MVLRDVPQKSSHPNNDRVALDRCTHAHRAPTSLGPLRTPKRATNHVSASALRSDGAVIAGMNATGVEEGAVDDDPIEVLEERQEEELNFNRYSQWKVNPIVHSKRGILGPLSVIDPQPNAP